MMRLVAVSYCKIGNSLQYWKELIINLELECSALNTLSQSLGWRGAILATQLNWFIPTVFPEKAHYIQMILQDNTNPPVHVTLDLGQLKTVQADVSYLLDLLV